MIGKEHSFDTEIAAKYGIHAAILLKNLAFWIEKNRANGRHLYEGRYWTYNSYRAWQDLFPYMSLKQIRAALEKLVKDGVLIKGNFNINQYDRTNWYAFSDGQMDDTDFGNSTCPTGQMDVPNQADGLAPEDEPIPDSNTDNKPNEEEFITPADAEVPSANSSFSEKAKFFIDRFNAIKGGDGKPCQYQLTTTVKDKLRARIRDGYNSKQIFAALRKAMSEQHHKDNGLKWITPEFILRSDKLEAYLHADDATKTGVPLTKAQKRMIGVSANKHLFGGWYLPGN